MRNLRLQNRDWKERHANLLNQVLFRHWRPVGAGIRQALRCSYTARYLSLACVEILVHPDKSELPRNHVWSWTGLRGEPSFVQWSDLVTFGCAGRSGWRGSTRRDN